MQARWPGVTIEFRGDSGFAIPALYDYLEEQGIGYTIGLATNSRLQALAAPQLEKATKQQAETGEKVRLPGEVQYAAGTWEHERRVIIKTELLTKGPNVCFVVTTRDDEPDTLYTFYIQRGGGPELWIKDLKDAIRTLHPVDTEAFTELPLWKISEKVLERLFEERTLVRPQFIVIADAPLRPQVLWHVVALVREGGDKIICRLKHFNSTLCNIPRRLCFTGLPLRCPEPTLIGIFCVLVGIDDVDSRKPIIRAINARNPSGQPYQ